MTLRCSLNYTLSQGTKSFSVLVVRPKGVSGEVQDYKSPSFKIHVDLMDE